MICKKCGSVIAEGELFCGNCGAPAAVKTLDDNVTQAADPQLSFAPQFDDQPVDFAPQFDEKPVDFAPQFDDQPEGYNNGKKPKNKKLIIALIAGGVVLLAGLIVLLVLLLNRKPPMAELEKDSFHKALEAFADGFGIENGTYTVDLEPGPYLKDLAENEGIDISWLKSVKADLIIDAEENSSGFGAKLAVNGSEIGAVRMLVDLASQKLSVQMDGVSDAVGVLDLSYLNLPIFGLASSIDKDQAVKLIEKYYDLVFDSIENVKESKGDFTANGVTEKCRILTADISQRQAMEIMKKVLSEALDDKELKDFVLSMHKAGAFGSDYTSDELYDMMQEGISGALDSVSSVAESASDTTMFTLADYVSDNKIIGRTVRMYSGDIVMWEITFGNAHDGDKFGTILRVNGKDYLLGSGTQNGSVLNGDLVIYGSDGEFATVTLYNFNYDDNEGGFEISLSKSAWETITSDSSLAATLALVSARIDKAGDSVTVDFLAGKERLLKATLSKRPEHDVKIDSSLAEKEIYDWIDTIDFKKLYNRLLDAGVPDWLMSSARSSVPIATAA